jgi:hypothetical protein
MVRVGFDHFSKKAKISWIWRPLTIFLLQLCRATTNDSRVSETTFVSQHFTCTSCTKCKIYHPPITHACPLVSLSTVPGESQIPMICSLGERTILKRRTMVKQGFSLFQYCHSSKTRSPGCLGDGRKQISTGPGFGGPFQVGGWGKPLFSTQPPKCHTIRQRHLDFSVSVRQSM